MFDTLDLERMHHAYMLVGERESMINAIERFLMREGISVKGNPDYLVWTGEQFLINDSHTLIQRTMVHGTAGKKFFVCAFSSATHEAQNALLKILEEPPRGTYFFIIVPSFSVLLPTVRSRMIALSFSSDPIKENNMRIETFLSAAPAQRLAMIKDHVQDKAGADGFFAALERYFASHTKTIADLETLYRARAYVRDRGSSPKMLLEYMALMLSRRV